MSAASLAQQAQHLFSRRSFHFSDTAPKGCTYLLQRLEIDPAMEIDGRYYGANMLFGFNVDTTAKARESLRETLVAEIGGKVQGSAHDPWFTFKPAQDVLTPQLVARTLGVLYDTGMIEDWQVGAAAQAFNIAAPQLDGTKRSALNLYSLRDAEKPLQDARDAAFVAALMRPVYRPYGY